MIRLIEPKKDDDVTADFMREVVRAIRMITPKQGVGIKLLETSDGTVVALSNISNRSLSPVTYPKAFDLAQGSGGSLKLVNCYFQIGSSYYNSTTEPEFIPASGSVCVIINTSTGEITAAMNAVFNRETPELLPVRLYVIDATGEVLCDCRGSQVVVYA